jgi:hypothetical protein
VKALVFAAALAGAGCVGDNLVFNCDGTHACGSSGACIAGACAFSDTKCSSGLRYDSSAAAGRSGQCVDTSVMFDLTMGPMDLAGADFTGVDFSGVDLLTPVDLLPPPDLLNAPDLRKPCVPSGAELCFDGVDNDCNGLTDCEDTAACSAIAECVPAAAATAQYGAMIATGMSCPTHYGSPAFIGQTLSVPGGCSGCSCTPSLVCATTLHQFPANTCAGSTMDWPIDNTACWPINLTTRAAGVDLITSLPHCAPSGVPGVPPATWAQSAQFCQTTEVGFCPTAGSVCVAKTGGSKHCTLDAANASCTGNYALQGGGTWYTGVTDNRTCGASCVCGNPSGGSCGTQAFPKVFQNQAAGCGGAAATFNPGTCLNNLGLSSYLGATVSVAAGSESLPACQPSNAVSGTATASGQSTLCCL